MLALVISVMVANYSNSTNQEIVVNSASVVRAAVQQQFETSGISDFNQYVYYESQMLTKELNIAAQCTSNMWIFITDKNGVILAADDHAAANLNRSSIDMTQFDLSAGSFKGYTDFDGMFTAKRLTKMATLNGANTGVYGYVFVCLPESMLSGFVKGIVKAIGIASLWVLAAALVAVYFLSERIVAPIRDISQVAKKFAQGHFEARIPVRGRDEISELAIAFNNMATSLENTENMRSAFIGNISHELRTPMTTISGFIDGMLDGAIPIEKHDHYLQIISGEVKRLSRLVSSLLDITKIQAGERKFNPISFDICETARQIIISCEQRLNDKKLDVEFTCDEDNMLAYADPDAIYQILYNLCDNAIKFSHVGGKYRVSIIRNEEKIFVSVYNEGIGIKSEDLPFVFERFYKGDKSRGLDKAGLGLGLYICKAIMDAHGEEIWVKSEYEKYCEFVFTLQSALESENVEFTN
ncbi:MAG: HAMP domain-containing histidine kinase [Clostridiales bacterium]|nr:HAMP domain-containing histidine kinase [Clostridiales bacterium]